MKIFDPINTPLTGTNLIEASAGTGKTYTIAGLFLRLILEKQLTVNQVLVVTFTTAATEELKERIRNTLLDAKSAFLKDSSDDVLINAIVKKYDNRTLAIQLIQDALMDFDNAAIFTIHGFCQRILNENAFETQSRFDTELVADPTALTREIVDDFWRKHFYSLPMEFISYLLNKISGPEYFIKLMTKNRTADVKIVPEIEKPDLTSLDDFRSMFKRLQIIWPNSRIRVTHLLKDSSLSGSVYGSLKTTTMHSGVSKRDLMVASIIALMDKFVDEKSAGFPLFKGFEKFTATKIENSTRKNHKPLSHEYFDICDTLYHKGVSLETEMETYLMYFKTQCFKFTREQLLIRKKQNNIQFYDDLLIKLKIALEDKGGKKLSQIIRKKYSAALVDEFQDTDSFQYIIFSRIFDSKKNTFFMIGDPKQSIYGFRGADIFSYMKAARNTDSKYTLIKNWRSNPNLITAVNAMFSNINRPFVFDRIEFEKGIPGNQITSMNERSLPALTLWYLEANKKANTQKPLSKTESVPIIAKAVAKEISRLISKNKNNLPHPINAKDIAVLVRTNRQAQIIKTHLSFIGIPSVLYLTGNIFHTHEAMEMERILLSIAEPGNERAFNAALVTDALGVFGEGLDSASDELFGLEAKSNRFREYFRLWTRHGFIRMFRLLMAEEKIRERLLSFPDGERRLTNHLHLAEILHQESSEKKLGITSLLKWLSEQRNAEMPESEMHQLRLESDDQAVKIITIHKSKGLEFPVVFCPFAWEGSLINDQEILFHNSDNNETLTLDLGSKDFGAHLAIAQHERLAENLRLLYVAITRAIHKCYLMWGRFNTAETSAIAYLLHYKGQPKDVLKENLLTYLRDDVLEKNEEDLLEDLKELSTRSEGSIEIVPLPFGDTIKHSIKEDKKEKMSCRHFSGKIDTTWKISSFSHLISQQAMDAELPDRDVTYDLYTQRTENDLNLYTTENIFSFPKGTRAGIFFHDIFEHLDFAQSSEEERIKLISSKLKEYRFESKWQKPVSAMVDNVLSIPLCINNTTLMLSSVHCLNRINEMAFYFPLKPVSPNRLRKIFADYGGIDLIHDFPDQLNKLSFSLTKGFMKGYIDMVFHDQDRFWLVDWKSNYLGNCVEDYGKNVLNKVMKKDFYILQYHLYIIALYQYLQMRIPDFSYERHFGGIFYIFIRGVDPDKGPEFGIYKDIPDKTLVDALLKALILNEQR
ncbi:MAG: exodeoxyribonuclease V subunit beta [Desulfobacterales bacterium]|jgi:exodeoxyribonuclease V beta subunit